MANTENDHSATLTKIFYGSLALDLWFGIFGCDTWFWLFLFVLFWFAISFCGIGFGIFGSGSLVWDLWFEIFALKPLQLWFRIFVLISLIWNLRFGIFALRPAVRKLWFGIFGLCALVWDLWFGLVGLRSSCYFFLLSFGLLSSVWDLWFGILVWDLWCEISGFVSLIRDLWLAIFGLRSSAWDLWLYLSRATCKSYRMQKLSIAYRCYRPYVATCKVSTAWVVRGVGNRKVHLWTFSDQLTFQCNRTEPQNHPFAEALPKTHFIVDPSIYHQHILGNVYMCSKKQFSTIEKMTICNLRNSGSLSIDQC